MLNLPTPTLQKVGGPQRNCGNHNLGDLQILSSLDLSGPQFPLHKMAVGVPVCLPPGIWKKRSGGSLFFLMKWLLCLPVLAGKDTIGYKEGKLRFRSQESGGRAWGRVRPHQGEGSVQN